MSENNLTTDPIVDNTTEPSPVLSAQVLPPPKPKFPIFLAILATILSVVSVFCIYLFIQVRELSLDKVASSPSPTPVVVADPTADWETYTNNEYGFTIKYPLAAKIRTEQPPSNDKMFIFAIDSPNVVFDRMFKSGDYSFEISIQTQKNFPAISDYLNFQKEHNTYKEVTPTTINNVSGYKFETDGYATTNFHYQGFVTKNDDLYITVNYFTDQDLKMFDQILSTLKFVDASSATYTCPASGYTDCMPSPDGPKSSCTDEAIKWYKANCPDFKGGAL